MRPKFSFIHKFAALCYFAAVIYSTLLIEMRFRTLGYRNQANFRLLIAKVDKIKVFKYLSTSDKVFFWLEIAGNIIMFMPFSYAFYVLSGRKTPTVTIVLLMLLATAAIEIAQYVFYIGVFDVDDIFLNFLGGVAGFLVFNYIYKKNK